MQKENDPLTFKAAKLLDIAKAPRPSYKNRGYKSLVSMKQRDNHGIISMPLFARVVQTPEPLGSDRFALKTAGKKYTNKKNGWQVQKNA